MEPSHERSDPWLEGAEIEGWKKGRGEEEERGVSERKERWRREGDRKETKEGRENGEEARHTVADDDVKHA